MTFTVRTAQGEDDFDLDFFKSIGYSVPGYFMEKRLIDRDCQEL